VEFDLSASKALLSRTPEVLRILVSDLPDAWTQSNYGEGTWPVHEVIGHLVWGERTDWLERVRRIMSSGDAVAFEPFDRRGHRELCAEHSTAELIELFAREREENLAALESMQVSNKDFSRTGLHPALGPVTLSQLLATWTVHDLNHIAQVCKAMAFQYSTQVGPWAAYLSILAPPNPR
jgi:hypothetical protein